MFKRLLAISLMVGIALLIQVSCSSGPGNPNNPPNFASPTGTVVAYGGDAPLCSIISFNITITGMTLTPVGTAVGGTSSPSSILASGQSLTLDFASLMDFTASITLANVPTGSYSQLNLTLANPQLTYWDTTLTPPRPTTLNLNLSSLNVTLNLSPALAVTASGAAAIQLDFNLLKSVVLDQNGQITSNVQPVFTVAPVTVGTNPAFVKIQDLRGMVSSVTTTSTNSAYTGSFALQSTAGPTVTVYVSGPTTYAGVAGLSSLTSNTFVQVAAAIDASGNLLASRVQAEGQESAANGQVAFRGLISSVTRDTSGNATQFNLLVGEEAPAVTGQVPLESVLTFNVNSSTTFAITAEGQAANLANFTFDATTLGVGQQVVAHAQLPAAGTLPFTATPQAVYLGTQSILGNLSTSATAPVVVGNDGKTGGFTLLPCSPLYQSQPITAISYFQTTFAGTGLTSLTSLQTPGTHFLLLQGLLFYRQQTGNLNSVAWPAPANVQVATVVHQLPQ
jgi:Domain of unknown function (DUF4382)